MKNFVFDALMSNEKFICKNCIESYKYTPLRECYFGTGRCEECYKNTLITKPNAASILMKNNYNLIANKNVYDLFFKDRILVSKNRGVYKTVTYFDDQNSISSTLLKYHGERNNRNEYVFIKVHDTDPEYKLFEKRKSILKTMEREDVINRQVKLVDIKKISTVKGLVLGILVSLGFIFL